AAARDAATALTVFGRALQGVDDIFQRNALVRAAGGRGGLQSARFLTGLDVNALTEARGGKGLSEDLINNLSALEVQSQKSASKAKQYLESIFAESAIKWEADWNKAFEKLSEAAADYAKQGGVTDKIGAWVV